MEGKRKRTKAYKDSEENPEGRSHEQLREQRIREKEEKLQRLGILDLSLKLNCTKTKAITRNAYWEKKTTRNTVPVSDPPRRSSRLKSMNPVRYSELRDKKKSSLEDVKIYLREGSQPEIYTEEHEKLLGDCMTPWPLFVDGDGEDGKRIYDPVKGQSCHQCRQKTLGCHTYCSRCNMGQGQFCGDCLHMRYGENAIEAKQNSNWVCPVCRGICDCSFCRQAKGYTPTGALYRKVVKLGFKSVAHYLIQTRRLEANPKPRSGGGASLPLKDIEPLDNSGDGSQDTDSFREIQLTVCDYEWGRPK